MFEDEKRKRDYANSRHNNQIISLWKYLASGKILSRMLLHCSKKAENPGINNSQTNWQTMFAVLSTNEQENY